MENDWHVSQNHYGPLLGAIRIVDSSGGDIAKMSGDGEESRDNARLMAAAPKLLKVLKELTGMIGTYRQRVIEGEITGKLLERDFEAWSYAKSVIAAAEGKQGNSGGLFAIIK
jgi:hypothetical protein